MKKLSVLFVSALALGMSFVSCSKDDDAEITSAAIEGKWNWSKMATVVGTYTSPDFDFPNSCSSTKDYVELKTGAVEVDGEYDSSCTLVNFTSTWSRNGNTLVLDGENYEILSLTNTTLKIKSAYADDSQTSTTVFTLIR